MAVKPEKEAFEHLITALREERQGEAYWNDFLGEFHRRQHAVPPAFSFGGMFGRVRAWFGELGAMRWAYGAGFGYAAVTLGFLLSPPELSEERLPSVPVYHQVIPEKPRMAEPVDAVDKMQPGMDAPEDEVF